MQGYFIIQCIQTMGKTRIVAALSFPFPYFNLNTLNVNDCRSRDYYFNNEYATYC